MALVLEQLIRQAAQLGPRPSPTDVETVVLAALRVREYWEQLVEDMDGPARMLHWPDSGVRVAVTHRRYECDTDPESRVRLIEERHLASGAIVTMVPPNDIHSHGHLLQENPPGHTLIVLGDAQEKFLRYEYDPMSGEPTPLHPGDMGNADLSPDVARSSPL